MLTNQPVILHDERPLERRGKKRATPLVENQASLEEHIFSLLMRLKEHIGNSQGFWQTDTYQNQIEDILTNSAHLKTQVNYLRKNTQH